MNRTMNRTMNSQDLEQQLKANVTELAKDIKSEADLNTLTQKFVKMTVEAELEEHLGYTSTTAPGTALGTAVIAPAPND